MIPTSEQIAAWAREASAIGDSTELSGDALIRFAALVDAHRAEQDAKLCDKRKAEILSKINSETDELEATMFKQIAHFGCGDDVAAIRANAPKGTP